MLKRAGGLDGAQGLDGADEGAAASENAGDQVRLDILNTRNPQQLR